MNLIPDSITEECRPQIPHGMMRAEDEPFRWDVLVARVLHPLQVQIIEAMRWIGCPLASSELRKIFDEDYTVSHLGYHISALAKHSVLRAAGTEQVRGAIKHYYVLSELQ